MRKHPGRRKKKRRLSRRVDLVKLRLHADAGIKLCERGAKGNFTDQKQETSEYLMHVGMEKSEGTGVEAGRGR